MIVQKHDLDQHYDCYGAMESAITDMTSVFGVEGLALG